MGLRNTFSKWFPHNNKRCVVPPGAVRQTSGRPVIVSSLMRSGTHLLIDTLLNNFKNLRNSPLYIDFDQYALKGCDPIAISEIGAYVIKTHYPQVDLPPEYVLILEKIANRGVVIQPKRDLSAIENSFKGFLDNEQEVTSDWLVRFPEYWAQFDVHSVKFETLVGNEVSNFIKEDLSNWLQMDCDSIVTPRAKANVNRILLDKLATRILGNRAPRINTTVKFGG